MLGLAPEPQPSGGRVDHTERCVEPWTDSERETGLGNP